MVAEVTAATPELDTAAPGFETPPVEETPQPETNEPLAPETVVQDAPETEQTPQETAFDPEAAWNHPDIKARVSRETESIRRKSEHDTEQRIQDARSSWVATGQAFQDVHAAIADGNVQQAQQLLGAALANRDWQAVHVIDRIGRAQIADGKVAAEDIDRLDAALSAAQRGTGTLDDYANVLLEVRAKAYAENTLTPQIEARIRKEIAATDRAKAVTAKVQAAEAANDAQGRPTLGVPGAGGSRVILNTREVDAIPTQTFLGLSKETQTRLVNEAREGDRLHADRLDRSLIQTALGR